MIALRNTFACCVLWISTSAATAVFAQTVSVNRTHIASDPADVALNNLLLAAQTAMDSKDYQTAASDYQEYLVKNPDEAPVHFQLGYAYTAMQKPDAAIPEYERAIALDPKMPAAYLNLGITLLSTNPGAAVDPLRKADELSPDQASTKYFLGRALELSDQVAAAIAEYEAAEKLDGENADVHAGLGRAYLRTSRPAKAESQFRTVISLRRDLSAAHLGLAEALAAQKKPDAASTEYQTYLATQPGNLPARIEYAAVLVDLEKYDDALSQLDQASKNGNESLAALKLRTNIYLQKKRYDDAVRSLRKAEAAAPADPEIPALLGHAYLEEKDYPEAEKEIAAALKARPEANDILENLVMARYGNKNYQGALDGLDLLSRRTTLSVSGWFVRAACYDKLGQAAPALDAYKKFLDLNTDQNSDMYFEASARARILTREMQNKR